MQAYFETSPDATGARLCIKGETLSERAALNLLHDKLVALDRLSDIAERLSISETDVFVLDGINE